MCGARGQGNLLFRDRKMKKGYGTIRKDRIKITVVGFKEGTKESTSRPPSRLTEEEKVELYRIRPDLKSLPSDFEISREEEELDGQKKRYFLAICLLMMFVIYYGSYLHQQFYSPTT